MSDYTAPDKVAGNQWSPTEHNLMKAAINSKLDKSAVITDPNATPSNTTVWTTGAVANYISNISGGGIIYKGELSGSENLNSSDFRKTGFWIAKGTFFENPVHASFPLNEQGVLTIHANSNYSLQTYISLLEGNKMFNRTYIVATDTWTGWDEKARMEWVESNFAEIIPVIPEGTPTVTCTTGVTINIYNSTDLKGLIALTNNTGSTVTAGTNITITFEHTRSGLNTILLTPFIVSFSELKVAPYGSPSSTNAVIRITQNFANNEIINFFYLIQ